MTTNNRCFVIRPAEKPNGPWVVCQARHPEPDEPQAPASTYNLHMAVARGSEVTLVRGLRSQWQAVEVANALGTAFFAGRLQERSESTTVSTDG